MTDTKHERRVVGYASGQQEQMDTCVCGKPWPCPELRTSNPMRNALQELADAAEEQASSEPDMPSNDETCQRFDAALAAARAVLATPVETKAPNSPDSLYVKDVHYIRADKVNAEVERLNRIIQSPGASDETGAGVDVEQAFEAGWRVASEWAKRDDLLADIGSAAYHADLTKALKSVSRPALKASEPQTVKTLCPATSPPAPHRGPQGASTGDCIYCGTALTANDIQARPLYRCDDEQCPGNHLSPGSVCKAQNGDGDGA
jgi:hypothetical protein